ncbi:MAG: hypothetical protein MST12_10075, partial [Spirochaetia bacterium]|nr:hypothetical protein [Spirochaetia bacterium]
IGKHCGHVVVDYHSLFLRGYKWSNPFDQCVKDYICITRLHLQSFTLNHLTAVFYEVEQS